MCMCVSVPFLHPKARTAAAAHDKVLCVADGPRADVVAQALNVLLQPDQSAQQSTGVSSFKTHA